jgi:catechol 2,3-dioxygenase-like lactoylglutathione lyase family enzyme
MSRVQLALNVADIEAAVGFYTKLFGTEPAKRRPGYANFAIATPPLKLVLIETAESRTSGVAGALNHLGIEVDTPEQVQEATRRLAAEGLAPDITSAEAADIIFPHHVADSDVESQPVTVTLPSSDRPVPQDMTKESL